MRICCTTKFCPKCDEEIELVDFPVTVVCPECQEEWYVSTDGDFENGMWHDMTKLIKL